MSKYSRFLFVKKIYPEYLVFIKVRDHLETFDFDLELLNLIGDANIFTIEVNYLILDNLDIMKIEKFPLNNYVYYYEMNLLIDVVDYIKKKVE